MYVGCVICTKPVSRAKRAQIANNKSESLNSGQYSIKRFISPSSTLLRSCYQSRDFFLIVTISATISIKPSSWSVFLFHCPSSREPIVCSLGCRSMENMLLITKSPLAYITVLVSLAACTKLLPKIVTLVLYSDMTLELILIDFSVLAESSVSDEGRY